MPGGPIYPISAVPITSGKVYGGVYYSSASTFQDEGMQVMASLDGDAIWRLVFPMPPALPSGTCKLQLYALANAATGDTKVNPKWASVAPAESAAAATRNAEGTSTLSWSAGDADKYKELEITLDVDTPVAGEFICMDLTFETASWTLAVVSTWIARIVWE